jgi:hypothetical protein
MRKLQFSYKTESENGIHCYFLLLEMAMLEEPNIALSLMLHLNDNPILDN